MPTDPDLRRALVDYRENVIHASTTGTTSSRRYGVLRRAMIDHLVEWKPTTQREWLAELPPYLMRRTEPEELSEHGAAIVAIVSRHVRFNGGLRAIGGRAA